MSDTTAPHEESPEDGRPLSERFLDLFVFLPTGLAVTVVEELPQLVERGRDRLGMQVNSARAVGQFAVKAGGSELKRRSEGLRRTGGTPSATPPRTPGTGGSARSGPPRLRSIPRPPVTEPVPAPTDTAPTDTVPDRGSSGLPSVPAPDPGPPTADAAPSVAADPTPAAPAPRPSNGHVPEVASLAIPGFDTLSASQVVQRLDGLSRQELVAVRAYETSTRGRRTILSRVDQLLDERS
jgi:hypothetical protein